MKIAIGADHRGFSHKQFIQTRYTNIIWTDVGTDTDSVRSDYPLFAQAVCSLMQSGTVDKGILICATGIGMAIAANRFAGIYAAVVWNKKIALLGVAHDKVNLLVLPSDIVSCQRVQGIIDTWLSAHFLERRYQKRITLIDDLGGVVAPQDPTIRE